MINGVQERQPRNLVRELADAIENRQPVALATVIEVKGASPAQLGFKLLVCADGSYIGNVGGGELEDRVRQAAQEALAEGRPRTLHYSLREEGEDAIGMLCGGEVAVFEVRFVTTR